ncbi:MAG: cellulase family glycosylhydrolase [Lentisphaerae bacterium]|mgnify:FL=1|nr:cellulase family glycosylhydrolase [Lentisphaerota bacterium]MBT7056233.1 cellulase family glycosylhydrolase [Lentisphaerota bacterium]MBT7847396.1 cellulase family glycosylhydrolase [Lentisphaerota bacterium]
MDLPKTAGIVAVFTAVLASGCRHLSVAEKGGTRMALTKDDVLSVRDGRFYLDGEPFAEISFNKFDLLWRLYDQLDAGDVLDDANPMVQAQDTALRELHEMGLRTIRIFALPWGPRGPESYADPEKRKLLYQALDRTLELCDRHDIRIVWSLAAGTFTDTKLVPGKGWVHGEEQKRELMSNPDSRGRQLLYRYIDETVARYKDRKAVLMWEVGNETTLSADIGSNDRIYNGERMPTLKDVAGFFDDVAKRIKAADPLRLVNSGGSHMRESQWNLYTRRSWDKDTFEEQFKCFDLLYTDNAVDVIDVHSYMNNKPGYVISDGAGGEAFLDNQGWMTIAQRIGKPLMIGELGLNARARTDKKIWDATPDYFESYSDTAAAKPWLEKSLNGVIDAGVQLSYWWCYQSDRPMDQNNPQRFDLTRERNPELLECFVDANRRLQQKLGAAVPPENGK